MRAISPFANYSIVLVNSVPKRGVDKTGAVVEYSDTEPILAQFAVTGLTKWEEAVAVESFGDAFGALPEGVNPITRVSVFDSELYCQSRYADEQEREAKQILIDKRLQELAKQYPNQLLVVEIPAAAKPWPTYDDHKKLEDILALQVATGTDPNVIWRYESENLKRAEVLAAMEDMIAEREGGKVEESIKVAL